MRHKYPEVKYTRTAVALVVTIKVNGTKTVQREFPSTWTNADVEARLSIQAEDPRKWPSIPPQVITSETATLRHLLLQTHFSQGHDVDLGSAICKTCGTNFLEDSVDEIRERQIQANHPQFVSRIQEEARTVSV